MSDTQAEGIKALDKETMIYLASPYSHEEAFIREVRYQGALMAVGALMAQDFLVVSPIVHCHEVAIRVALPSSWDYWKKFCTALLLGCGQVVVLKLPGWEDSKGIAAELAISRELHLPIIYLDYFDYPIKTV